MPNPSIKDLAYRGLAATLGGPVDLASMVMRPFGYSTPDAQVVGGSEWMGKKMEDMGIVSSARSPLQEFAASMTIPTPGGIGKGLAMAAPALIGATRGLGKAEDALKTLDTLNPTGSVFANYAPEVRASLPLGKNITTLDKTMGGKPDDLITIYRGAPRNQNKINPGDFITDNQQLAKDYAGDGHVIKMQVKRGDVLDDVTDPLGNEYIYRPNASTRGIGKVNDAFKNPIENVLQSMSRNIDDDSINAAFGANGYVYHTPLRPFENSQQSAIGVKATPLAERVFTTDTPLSAAQLRAIEAIPMSDNSTRAIAKEIADSGAFAFMHKDGKRFSVVMPSAKNDKTIQTTQYDTKGAIGDSQHGSNEDAIKELIYSGYTKILDPDRAEKMMERVMLK